MNHKIWAWDQRKLGHFIFCQNISRTVTRIWGAWGMQQNEVWVYPRWACLLGKRMHTWISGGVGSSNDAHRQRKEGNRGCSWKVQAKPLPDFDDLRICLYFLRNGIWKLQTPWVQNPHLTYNWMSKTWHSARLLVGILCILNTWLNEWMNERVSE